MIIDLIKPDWPAPVNIFACSTTRQGGYSQAPYHHLNLADHVGDDIADVASNREYLSKTLQWVQEPAWLQQTHSVTVVELTGTQTLSQPADASYTRKPGQVCVVLSADCLPILVCDRAGRSVAAIHAGWRGLAAGIVEQTLRKLKIDSSELLVWFGPAIGPEHFEVGEEVRNIFVSQNEATAAAFQQNSARKYFADIFEIARIRLHALGVNEVYGGHWCTYADSSKFFSYRRDQVTGRIATLISIA
ncbi:MAG: peptidoglycan editing factor PgeF [Thiohalomonadales bacterium]